MEDKNKEVDRFINGLRGRLIIECSIPPHLSRLKEVEVLSSMKTISLVYGEDTTQEIMKLLNKKGFYEIPAEVYHEKW